MIRIKNLPINLQSSCPKPRLGIKINGSIKYIQLGRGYTNGYMISKDGVNYALDRVDDVKSSADINIVSYVENGVRRLLYINVTRPIKYPLVLKKGSTTIATVPANGTFVSSNAVIDESANYELHITNGWKYYTFTFDDDYIKLNYEEQLHTLHFKEHVGYRGDGGHHEQDYHRYGLIFTQDQIPDEPVVVTTYVGDSVNWSSYGSTQEIHSLSNLYTYWTYATIPGRDWHYDMDWQERTVGVAYIRNRSISWHYQPAVYGGWYQSDRNNQLDYEHYVITRV